MFFIQTYSGRKAPSCSSKERNHLNSLALLFFGYAVGFWQGKKSSMLSTLRLYFRWRSKRDLRRSLRTHLQEIWSRLSRHLSKQERLNAVETARTYFALCLSRSLRTNRRLQPHSHAHGYLPGAWQWRRGEVPWTPALAYLVGIVDYCEGPWNSSELHYRASASAVLTSWHFRIQLDFFEAYYDHFFRFRGKKRIVFMEVGVQSCGKIPVLRDFVGPDFGSTLE